MAKGDADRAQSLVDQTHSTISNQSVQSAKEYGQNLGDAMNSDASLRNSAIGNFNQTSTNAQDIVNRPTSFYAPTQAMLDSLFGSGTGISGGIDESLISSMGAEPYAGFKNFADNGGLSAGFNQGFGKDVGGIEDAMSQFADTARTGGFSDHDLSMMRARAVAPTTSIYQNAQDQLQSARNTGGVGASPNFAAATAKMARDTSQSISDADIKSESDIAQMVQQGKIAGMTGEAQAGASAAAARTQVQALDDQMRAAGLAGMSDIDKARLQGELANAQINMSASAAGASIAAAKAMAAFQAESAAPWEQTQGALAGNAQILGAGQGFNTLYGTTPANTALWAGLQFGNQSRDQSNMLSLINAQIAKSGVKSDFQQAMDNVGSAGKAIGSIVSPFAGGFGGGGQGSGGSGSTSIMGGMNGSNFYPGTPSQTQMGGMNGTSFLPNLTNPNVGYQPYGPTQYPTYQAPPVYGPTSGMGYTTGSGGR